MSSIAALSAIAILGISAVRISSDEFNLGFEFVKPNGQPTHWYTGGSLDSKSRRLLSAHEEGFDVSLDSLEKHQGKYSLHLKTITGAHSSARSGDLGESMIFDQILESTRGKIVTYSGWIKTSKVSNWAGLWWRVDSGNKVLAFNNMYDSALRGTHDWKRYSFTIPVSNSATGIDYGVIMCGDSSEAWFDELSIDTNGKSYAR